jgi:hypothetical protein
VWSTPNGRGVAWIVLGGFMRGVKHIPEIRARVHHRTLVHSRAYVHPAKTTTSEETLPMLFVIENANAGRQGTP